MTPYAGPNCAELGKAEYGQNAHIRGLSGLLGHTATSLDLGLLAKDRDRLPQHLCLGRLRKSEAEAGSGPASPFPTCSPGFQGAAWQLNVASAA